MKRMLIPRSERGWFDRHRVDEGRIIYMTCPSCGTVASLEEHKIDDDGTVEPSVSCPDCAFHEHIALRGYER